MQLRSLFALLLLVGLGGLQAQGASGADPAAKGATPPAAPIPAPAETLPAATPLILPDDPAPILGLTLPEALRSFGSPASVAAFRGAEPWQDDVIFSYPARYEFFWFGDRVWQIRFLPGYAGSICGVFLGDPADKIYSLLGTPYYATEDSLVYRLPYRGFPVRLRLVLAEERVTDVYFYRADF